MAVTPTVVHSASSPRDPLHNESVQRELAIQSRLDLISLRALQDSELQTLCFALGQFVKRISLLIELISSDGRFPCKLRQFKRYRREAKNSIGLIEDGELDLTSIESWSKRELAMVQNNIMKILHLNKLIMEFAMKKVDGQVIQKGEQRRLAGLKAG
mmetsp:Transcript_49665/g.72589  ORF Transcript_49665/g.72589 Transcript_49665/m.72589 type:complete len:157 (-) Transcript_49665:31-501(-)